jgi:hypothetical protein
MGLVADDGTARVPFPFFWYRLEPVSCVQMEMPGNRAAAATNLFKLDFTSEYLRS